MFKHLNLFRLTGEMVSHIHCLKHQVGVAMNSESARYKELLEDCWYVPEDWPEHMKLRLDSWCHLAFGKYHEAIDELVLSGFTRKRAKESARFFLPMAMQYSWVMTMSFQAFANLVKLRRTGSGARAGQRNAQRQGHQTPCAGAHAADY